MPACSAMSATFAPWNPERANTTVAAAMIRSRVCALRVVRGACARGLRRLAGLAHAIAPAARSEASCIGVIPGLREHLVGVLTVAWCGTPVAPQETP